jgi:hypothetical protein
MLLMCQSRLQNILHPLLQLAALNPFITLVTYLVTTALAAPPPLPQGLTHARNGPPAAAPGLPGRDAEAERPRVGEALRKGRRGAGRAGGDRRWPHDVIPHWCGPAACSVPVTPQWPGHAMAPACGSMAGNDATLGPTGFASGYLVRASLN